MYRLRFVFTHIEEFKSTLPRAFAYLSIGLVVTLVMAPGASLNAVSNASNLPAQIPTKLKLDTGKEIYKAACVSCHGPDGRGQTEDLRGFELPATFPDFTNCATSTVEPDVQWRAIITNGGPARAFSEIMPSFRDSLTQDQITKVIEYMRTLCQEKRWPRGNFNLPRPLVTEKAFPENEWVFEGDFNTRESSEGAVSIIYERRFGSSGMVEFKLPYVYSDASGETRSGFGDMAVGYKQKLFDSLKYGAILSGGAEVIFPTGSTTDGTGGESTVFETWAAYGQILPNDFFVQFHSGIELPFDTDEAPQAFFARTALGKSFISNAGLGRRWSPMVEFIADRELETGAKTNWDLIPQMQIPLSKRGHVLANVGYRFPLNHTTDRPRQILFYVLWDYQDGGLLEGWK
jgi:mono/diheme cytochrome c family protein